VSEPETPLHLFRFHVEFRRESDNDVKLAYGAFAECTGLEATMEPKVIKAGGANYGAYQRAGAVTFATVILKRGITGNRDLWKWFAHLNEKSLFAYRLDVTISIFDRVADPGGAAPKVTIKLFRALPVKFKFGDLNARATDVGIEELHLAHEGLAIS
jgi:phage tail-like protein